MTGSQKLRCQRVTEQLAAHLPQHARRVLAPSHAVATKPAISKSPAGSAGVLRHHFGSYAVGSRPDTKEGLHPLRPHYSKDEGYGQKKPYPQHDITPGPNIDLIPQSFSTFAAVVEGDSLSGLTCELTNNDFSYSGGQLDRFGLLCASG